MAKRIVPRKPVDRTAYEPVLLALHEARAMAFFLEKLGDEDSALVHGIDADHRGHPEDAIAWAHGAIADRLRAAHDAIEREYRKLGTDLFVKDAAAIGPLDGA
jgi:hypothetical protein